MKIGLFGGTFDPVHLGHLLIAEAAVQAYELDRLIFVPAAQSPWKPKPVASSAQRLAMLKAAIRGHNAFSVSDWEIRQHRAVFTYETLEYFKQLFPKASLYFLVGKDAQRTLSRWKNARLLPSLARFITMDRIEPFASHRIRQQIKTKKSIRYHVPESVARYIRTHRLYRA